ncbi:MAG: hypothetical protein E7640_04690 [Ruminococcaceae bacterium]|nr:hypothetical protein [Oscillospiraceae bacterium]
MKRRLSLVFAVMMIAVVFTVIFTAMALPTSAATEAGDDDVVVTVYWHTDDDFSEVPAENKIEITKAEMLAKLPGRASANVTKSLAEAGNYIWVVFKADAQVSLANNGSGIGFYAARGKTLYVEGNGAIYNFNVADYDNGANGFLIDAAGSGTDFAKVEISDFTVNTRNDAALVPANCEITLDNVVLNSARHKGVNVTAGDAKLIFDEASTVYGGQHSFQVTSGAYDLEVSGAKFASGVSVSVANTAAKLTFDGVTVTGKLTASYLKGTLVINDSTINGPADDVSVWAAGKDAAANIVVSGTTTVTGQDAFQLQGDTKVTLTIKDSVEVTPTRYAVRLGTAGDVLNIEGGTLRTATDGMLRVDASDVTLNISGEDTLVENTNTAKCIINTNGKDNVKISVTDGATLKATGIAIYGNGGAKLDIDMDGANIECADERGAILRYSASATDTTDIENSTFTGGGLSVGGTLTIDNSDIDPQSNGHAINFSGSKLDITNGSTVTAAENKYTIKINSAATVTIDGGSVVSSASTGDRVSATQTHGHILFGTNGITLNISGENTIVESTATTAPNTVSGIIDINRMSGTINVEDGATIRSKAVNCIYNLGSAGTTVNINISGEDTLIQAGDAGNKIAVLMRQEQGTEGKFNMTGGTVNGGLSLGGKVAMSISITGGELNGTFLFSTMSTETVEIKNVTINTVITSNGANTMDFNEATVEFENCTINAKGGYHAITTRGTVDIKNTTINCSGTTVAVRAYASNDASSANITIDGDSKLIGDARGGAWSDSGTLEIQNGATVTIEAGAVVSSKSGTTIGVKTGGQVYSEGDISNETGMALVIFGYAEFTGGSIATGTTALDIPAMVGEGGEIGAFENVEFTGTLTAPQGTLTLDGTKVTLADDKITLEGGTVSAITVANGIALEMKDLTCTAPILAYGNLTLDNTKLTPAEGKHAIEFCGGTTLTIKNGSEITSSGAGFTIRAEVAGATVNIESGSTVISGKDSHIRFEKANVTLNITGEGTLVENTGTGTPINANENTGAKINITDGATVKSGGVCIYANKADLALVIEDATVLTTGTSKYAIQRNTPSADDTISIKNSTITGGGITCAGTLTIDGTEIDPGAATNAITFSGTTLKITNGSEITVAENKYTIRIGSAATVTIDGGSVVSSASIGDRVSATKTAGHIFFATNGATLNISGENTIVEGTSTASVNDSAGAVIDINRMSADINISDGATLRSKATTCIYNLGDAGTTVNISISGDDTLIQAGDNGDRAAILIRQEFATEGSITMTGGTVRGSIVSSVNNKVDISITGGEIYGQLNFQQAGARNKAVFKDVKISYAKAGGGSNTIDLADIPADFENCEIIADGGCHAITARSTVNIKNTTINCTGNTIAVRALKSSGDFSANITIDGDSSLIGDARGGAWNASGTIEVKAGATVTIEAGAVVSAKSGNTIGIEAGGQVYSEGDISNETGMALVIFGYAEITGGSLTTGTTAFDLPTMVGEEVGGEIGAFENVSIIGTLIVTEGTLTSTDGATVTVEDDELTIVGGTVSTLVADSANITGGTIVSANIADGAVIITNAFVGSMMRSTAASSIVADASGATFKGVSAEAIAINGITATLDNVKLQALAVADEADVTATNSMIAAESADALISVAGASTVTLNNTKVNNTGSGAAIAVADAEANEINVNNSQLNANSTVISAKDGENDQAATLNLNNVKIFANEGTPIEGDAALGFYVAAVKNPANAGAAEGQVEIDGVIYNVYTGAQGGSMTATDGASIRVSTGSNGLRFTAVLSAKTIDYINSIATDPASVEFGTAIFPTHLIAEAGLTTFDVPALKALGYTVLEIPANDAMNNRILGGESGNDVVGYTIKAAITNIKDNHLGWKYSAITYIKYTDAMGEHVVYGEYNEDNNSRSIIEVARMAYDDVKAPEDAGYNSSYAYPVGGGKYSPYTATQRAAIKAIIDKYEALNP